MSVRELSSGRWEVSRYLPGNRRGHNRRFRQSYDTETEARKIDAILYAAKCEGRLRQVLPLLQARSRGADSFREAAVLYWSYYCEPNNRDLGTKKARLGVLVEFFDLIPVREFAIMDVERFIVVRRQQKRVLQDGRVLTPGNATINRELAVLKHLFVWLCSRGTLEVNPLQHLRMLKTTRTERQKPTEEQINDVLAEVDPRARPLFVFIRETGCRRGEALGLTWDRVMIPERRVVLNKGKPGRPRHLFLTTRAIEAIQELPPESKFVFYNPATMGRWSDARTPWEKARKAAGVEWLQVKDLRRAFAIRLAEAGGIEMHQIAAALGHADQRTTSEFYAHFGHESTERAVLKVLEGGRKR